MSTDFTLCFQVLSGQARYRFKSPRWRQQGLKREAVTIVKDGAFVAVWIRMSSYRDALVGICVAILEEVLTPGSVSTFLCVCGSRCSDQLLLRCHMWCHAPHHRDHELYLWNCKQAPSEILSFLRIVFVMMSVHGNRSMTKTASLYWGKLSFQSRWKLRVPWENTDFWKFDNMLALDF